MNFPLPGSFGLISLDKAPDLRFNFWPRNWPFRERYFFFKGLLASSHKYIFHHLSDETELGQENTTLSK
jgi:hypothetical protein